MHTQSYLGVKGTFPLVINVIKLWNVPLKTNSDISQNSFSHKADSTDSQKEVGKKKRDKTATQSVNRVSVVTPPLADPLHLSCQVKETEKTLNIYTECMSNVCGALWAGGGAGACSSHGTLYGDLQLFQFLQQLFLLLHLLQLKHTNIT